MMYAIMVSTNHTISPTFYLDSNIQGIVSEQHARRIIQNWFSDLGHVAPVTVASQEDK